MVVKLFIVVSFLFTSSLVASSTRILDILSPESALIPEDPAPASAPEPAPAPDPVADTDLTMSFYMHDILGGSNPSARMITGIVDNQAFNGQFPFAKPNGAVLPLRTGVETSNSNSALINNNNIPFLTGLSEMTSPVFGTSGSSRMGLPLMISAQFSTGSTMEKLMFGTITVIDDQLTVGPELSSGMVGRAQGFYVETSVGGTSQAMAFTAMFESGDFVDNLCFFGVHLLGVSESQLAIMGGTGKFVNAKGYAVMRTLPPSSNQLETDGVQTVVELSVYVTY